MYSSLRKGVFISSHRDTSDSDTLVLINNNGIVNYDTKGAQIINEKWKIIMNNIVFQLIL